MRASSLNTLVLAVIVLCFAWRADAHAIVTSSKPGVSEIVSGPNVAVRLRFNARIDIRRSKLVLVGTGGERRELPVSKGEPADSLVSEAQGLKSGSYVLQWQVLAGDGHISRGEVRFTVR